MSTVLKVLVGLLLVVPPWAYVAGMVVGPRPQAVLPEGVPSASPSTPTVAGPSPPMPASPSPVAAERSEPTAPAGRRTAGDGSGSARAQRDQAQRKGKPPGRPGPRTGAPRPAGPPDAVPAQEPDGDEGNQPERGRGGPPEVALQSALDGETNRGRGPARHPGMTGGRDPRA